MIYINKIKYISKNHRNKENDIKFNIEHRIYEKLNNKLINFKQIL